MTGLPDFDNELGDVFAKDKDGIKRKKAEDHLVIDEVQRKPFSKKDFIEWTRKNYNPNFKAAKEEFQFKRKKEKLSKEKIEKVKL